ncbi:DUF6010 family protein [Hymenobacter crusticola]|uniref:Uncharacterized protein n=1 Tax=Hymenobacter crusticola TaxID=1770526 RepID=A0A243WGS3_9BACT|nr:DUF6010 family protein [Hymenobacter crusticola]OUJ74707.1 hypothetical protein BXP70_08055 [Hymenobacter crusticola]
MLSYSFPAVHLLDAATAVVVAGVFIALASLLREPARQRFMAILVAGAGAAHLNGGLGGWEFAFAALMTYCAYRGLQQYAFIGVAWLLHTAWDVAHHFYGTPIIAFVPTSSAQCAICDALLATWFFNQAPSVYGWFQRAPHRLA